MTSAALAQDLLTRAPIELRVEDRLPRLPIRGLSKATLAVAAGSLLVHVGLMAGALVVARAPQAMPGEQEIPVEIVREAPKQPEPKIEQAKREPPPAEPPKAAPNPEPAKVEQPKVEQVKLEPPPKPAAPPAQANEAKALQDELASLRAEQEALKADVTRAGSGKAVALAQATDGDGEMVDYQLLVFSQLAKAKEHTSFKGGVGTTGVKFMIDDNGGLARAEVTTPSGDEALDREALDIVRRAAPFPAPPKDAQRLVFANVNFVAPKQP